jgi:hypothetical protein
MYLFIYYKGTNLWVDFISYLYLSMATLGDSEWDSTYISLFQYVLEIGIIRNGYMQEMYLYSSSTSVQSVS